MACDVLLTFIKPFIFRFVLVVLNEVERCAKRQLIQNNRQRRQIEKVQCLLRRRSLPTRTEGVDQELIKSLTREYCRILDEPLVLTEHFPYLDPIEQFNSLLKEILSRTYSFAASVGVFKEVSYKLFRA